MVCLIFSYFDIVFHGKHSGYPFPMTALLNHCSYVLCFPEHSLHRDDEVVPWPSTHPLHPVMWGRSQLQVFLHPTQESFYNNVLLAHSSVKNILDANTDHSSVQGLCFQCCDCVWGSGGHLFLWGWGSPHAGKLLNTGKQVVICIIHSEDVLDVQVLSPRLSECSFF